MIGDKATVDNVKIVFFDVLAKQISSLIELKDKLATATEDKFDELSNEFESQFGLLKETLDNVKKLMGNVEMFDNGGKSTVEGASVVTPVSETAVIPNEPKDEEDHTIPAEGIDDGDFDEPTGENKFIKNDSLINSETNLEDTEVSPLIPVSPSFEKASEELIKNYNLSLDEDDKKEENGENETEKEDKPVQLVPDNILVDAQNEDSDITTIDNNIDEETMGEPADFDDEEETVEEKPTLVNIPEENKEEPKIEKAVEKVALDKCFKISDKQTKAIVVNVQQLEKLRKSRSEETNKLDFGIEIDTAASSVPTTDEMEKLLQQANDLYKQGRAIEAEQIYQRIRELNKK